MNWPEALTSIVALICGTLVVCLLVYLRRQQDTTDKLVELDGVRFNPAPPITPLEHREENVRLVPAEPDTTEAYTPPLSDLDNLSERLERIERNLAKE